MSTPLIETIRSENEELADYFLKVGATVNFKSSEDINDALWEALTSKKYSFLRRFINRKCLLSRSKENQIALIWATQQTDVEAVEILLTHSNIKVNERDNTGNTALHYNVSKSPHTEDDITIGKMLIAAGADINGTNFDGQTPEDMAQDYAAKTALLHSRIEQKLPEKEDVVIEEPTVETPGVHRTKNNKIKI
jgi:ankyrin repeat protein